MKVALIGYGKMGRIIERLALAKNHQIVARVNSDSSSEWNQLKNADVCIEFSQPDSVLSNLEKVGQFGLNCVIGTTGWYEQLDLVQALIRKYDTGILYSPNFSIGIHLFLQIVRQAAKLISPFTDYAVGGVEYHHQQKVDSPSGTAQKIADAVRQEMRNQAPLTFSSVRCGSFPGTHSVFFDSPIDTITLTHEARNREGFADGALVAAEWLMGKKGIYTLENCLEEKIQCH